MIKDEQEIRDFLEALESGYVKAGLAGHELAKTDPRIQILRWVLARDEPDIAKEVIEEWRKRDKEWFAPGPSEERS